MLSEIQVKREIAQVVSFMRVFEKDECALKHIEYWANSTLNFYLEKIKEKKNDI